MTPLQMLIEKQQNKCYYCNCEMSPKSVNVPDSATLEHLVDVWSSPKHQKSSDPSNLVAACFKCNNTRGNIRNKIARNYYQQLPKKKKMRVHSIQSSQLYALFGPVPQNLFANM